MVKKNINKTISSSYTPWPNPSARNPAGHQGLGAKGKTFSQSIRLEKKILPLKTVYQVLNRPHVLAKIENLLNISKIQNNVIWDNYNELSPNFYSDVSRFLSPSLRTLPLHMKLKGDRPSFMHNYEINGKSQ